MTYILMCILVFVALFLSDICWIGYFISIEKRNSLWAAIWGTTIYLFSIFAITNFIHDISLLIPAILGSFIGTYVVVEYKKRNEKR